MSGRSTNGDGGTTPAGFAAGRGGRPYGLALAVIFLVAVATRIVFAAVAGGTEVVSRFSPAKGDPQSYDWMARNILEQGNLGFRGIPSTRRAPGYPLFLAAVYGTCGPSYRAVRIVQSVLDASVCLVLFATLRRLGRPHAGLWSALVYALYPPYIFNASEVMTEGLVLFLTAWIAYLLVRAMSASRPAWPAAAAGLACGYLFLTRENNLVLAPLFAMLLGFGVPYERGLAQLKAPALFAAGFFALYTPYFVRNLVVFQRVLVTGTSGGENLLRSMGYALHGPDWDWHQFVTDNGLLEYWAFHDPANADRVFPDEVESDRRAAAMALDLIRRHPGRFVAYGCEKLVKMLLGVEVEARQRSAGTIRTAIAWIYRATVVLGLLGFLIAVRGRLYAFAVLHAILIVNCALLIVLVVAWKRYWYVGFVFACVSMAGFPLAAMWAWVRRRRRRGTPTAG